MASSLLSPFIHLPKTCRPSLRILTCRKLHQTTNYRRSTLRVLAPTNSSRSGSKNLHISSIPLQNIRMDNPGLTPQEIYEQNMEFQKRVGDFFTLEEVDKDVFRSHHLATVVQASRRAAFGGLIFAQALCAAEKTVPDELLPHAVHSFFILNVDTDIPVDYVVHRLRDGRSFCTRTVEAIQNGKVAFCLQVSFHKKEPDSCVHQSSMPSVPPPEECMTNVQFAKDILQKVENGELTINTILRKRFEWEIGKNVDSELFEIRPTHPMAHMGIADTPVERTMFYWMRTRVPVMSDCHKLHRYLVAFTTDSTLASTVIKPHLFQDFYPTMLFSLDHNIWLHEDEMRADQWLLFECHSTKAKASRGFVEARLWTRDGKLLLSAAQECLVRSKGITSKL